MVTFTCMGPAAAESMVWVGVTMVFVMFARVTLTILDVRLIGGTGDPRMLYTTSSTRTKTSKSRV